ncbi:RiPP maturation radical SAM C-methyltransferase [Polyangium sp. 15x6]|uniref:RiPP maturation radical SAM C-methyltransferase n=1 Tax=Polyangium sp. 15x6 TaxID=3042687 RepID=UPI00249C87EE|nr:RiPP maturation radical SAM C-methyltransferase [Polyangium sp. 15x6]MDI3288325.1 RiPP maturation radical SAM C-methyltransferase [Polyangium sp. 15x6]
MYRISLLNMPFAGIHAPSIALTQLRSRLEEQFGDRVRVDVLYFNQDLCNYLGHDVYQAVVGSMEHHTAGTGEWFFRQAAFPEAPDNTEEYTTRYFAHPTPRTASVLRTLLAKRRGLDAFLSELAETYDLKGARIVGLTSMFSQNAASMAMARKLKELDPTIVTVMGGANCEHPMGRVIVKNTPQIDYVFSGPALINFPQFVENHMRGEAAKNERLDGVFTKKNHTREKDGPVALGNNVAPAGAELPIDVPVALDYDDFFAALEKNFPDRPTETVLYFETSRGCWWGERAHCTFCGLNGASMAYRSMKSELALDLIHSLLRRYASKCKAFHSVDNILPESYIDEVVAKLEVPPDVDLFYEVKSNLTERDIEMLAKGRVLAVQPGVESLATSTLKLMRKGTTSFQNIRLLKHCALHGVQPQWNLLIGFPGETADTYEKYVRDLPSLVHLPSPTGTYPVRFDRFSPYFTQAEEYELDLHPFDFYELVYPFPQEDIFEMAYYFVDRNFEAEYFVDMVSWLDKVRARVDAWRDSHAPGCAPPDLHFLAEEGRPTVIRDSRFGEVVERDVGELGLKALQAFEKPLRLSTVVGHLGRTPEAEATVSALVDGRMLFQEGDLYVSLVLPRAPRLGRKVAPSAPSPKPPVKRLPREAHKRTG